MVLSRKEAVTLSSFMQMLTLRSDKMDEVINTALCELEKTDISIEQSNYYARKYIEYQFKWFTNDYLASFLTNKLNREIVIVGKEPQLHKCDCCGYHTIKKRGWAICPVCFWEDSNADLQEHSGPNHMTLQEAKNNFAEFGVMDSKFLSKVDADRFIRFKK